jgi:ubiquinone/menaquinone biosynthesis C-methylase UbiE
MTQTRSDPEYMPGRSDAETDRLVHQAGLYERITLGMLREAGVSPGMRVLDVGCGAGDVSMLAAALVGSGGSVVGVDVNPDILQRARQRTAEQGLANLEFREGDARTADVGSGYDAVVGRLVLMYMADPAQAVRALSRRVRPGGIVAFQEQDLTFLAGMPLMSGIDPAEAPVLMSVVRWILAAYECTGLNPQTGLLLTRTFLDAGLPEPALRLEIPMSSMHARDGFAFTAAAVRGVVPLLTAHGIASEDEIDIETLADRLQAECIRLRLAPMQAPQVTAWARVGG